MLYRLVVAVTRLALRVYFRALRTAGRENLPAAGPVILAGNHPNSLVDPAVIACTAGRRVRFMAKSTLFTHPIVGIFFRRFGSIPVYRRQDNPLDMSNNIHAFAEAYRVLERGEVLGIFPEGLSHPDLSVRRLKTGVARIALEAEARNEFKLGVVIVPVGLNFEDTAAFRSELLVNFGRPIEVARYRQTYSADPQLGVADLVEEVQRSLERLVLTVREVDLEDLVRHLLDIYGADLRALASRRDWSLGTGDLTPATDLALKKRLASAVEHFHRSEPELLIDLRERVESYVQKLRRLQLTDALLAREVGAGVLADRALRILLLGLAGLPIAIWGGVNNLVPYRLARYAGRRWGRGDRTLVSSARLGAGLILFPTFYGLQTAGVLWWLGERAAGLYLVSAAVGGLFALFWSRRLRLYRSELRFSIRYLTSRRLIAAMQRERRNLIRHLDGLRDRYLDEVTADRD